MLDFEGGMRRTSPDHKSLGQTLQRGPCVGFRSNLRVAAERQARILPSAGFYPSFPNLRGKASATRPGSARTPRVPVPSLGAVAPHSAELRRCGALHLPPAELPSDLLYGLHVTSIVTTYAGDRNTGVSDA